MGNKYAKGYRLTDEEYARPRKRSGTRMEEMRIAQGLTQEQFAEKVGLSQQSIAKWEKIENGESMAVKNVFKIADALDIPWIYAINAPQNPIPFRQLKKIETCWLEVRDQWLKPALIDRSGDDENALAFLVVEGSLIVRFADDYERTWRCWVIPPADVDLRNNPWIENA